GSPDRKERAAPPPGVRPHRHPRGRPRARHPGGGRGRHTAADVPAQHRLRFRHGHLLDGTAQGLGRRGDQAGAKGPLLHDGLQV
ncbi:MAG: hypothetical protein AVDCRST_MAG03-828, partial [uncultured Rubrobacteraceae bacterium]